MGNPMTSRDPERSNSGPKTFRAEYTVSRFSKTDRIFYPVPYSKLSIV